MGASDTFGCASDGLVARLLVSTTLCNQFWRANHHVKFLNVRHKVQENSTYERRKCSLTSRSISKEKHQLSISLQLPYHPLLDLIEPVGPSKK